MQPDPDIAKQERRRLPDWLLDADNTIISTVPMLDVVTIHAVDAEAAISRPLMQRIVDSEEAMVEATQRLPRSLG